ncbi:RRQRL motif-containing zinc-binding protein [Phytohabitans rumicis]|nr:RRQRL motif-containing zinc-binding protein [Phytohabitans rumicis]
MLRNRDLDFLVDYKGFFLEFYDPDGKRFGFPTFPYHCAPDGLVTRRQLRAAGLRPAGQPVIAQILWRHKKNTRHAYLYRRDLAKPKRVATPAQLAAVAKALIARRTCPTCEQVKGYYIPRRSGECLDCNPEVN